jgi:hypothetical protein
MPRRERVRSFVSGLVKFVALISVAGGCGVAIGYGLSRVSDERDVVPAVATGRQTETATTPARTATTAPPPARTTTTTPTPTPTATTTTGPATTTTPAGALAHVQVRVLGAILRPAGTADGRRRRRARLTMRVQAVNAGDEAVTLGRPVLAVGKVRIGTDTAAQTADAQLGRIAAGATKAATLRFELAGEATEKITIDRRARVNVGGRSLAFRLILGSPVRPPATTQAGATTPATAPQATP